MTIHFIFYKKKLYSILKCLLFKRRCTNMSKYSFTKRMRNIFLHRLVIFYFFTIHLGYEMLTFLLQLHKKNTCASVFFPFIHTNPLLCYLKKPEIRCHKPVCQRLNIYSSASRNKDYFF